MALGEDLAEFVAEPERPVGELSLIDGAELAELGRWSYGAAREVPSALIPDVIVARAAAAPYPISALTSPVLWSCSQSAIAASIAEAQASAQSALDKSK